MYKCFITLLWQMFYNIIRVKCFQWNNRKMSKQTSSDSKRSCHGGCSIKEGVFKNFANFTGSHVCQSLFFNTVVVKLSNCIMVVNLFFFFFFFFYFYFFLNFKNKNKICKSPNTFKNGVPGNENNAN